MQIPPVQLVPDCDKRMKRDSVLAVQVAARAEEMLRERLSQRDQRITELKSTLTAAETAAADTTERLAPNSLTAHPQAATQTDAQRITGASGSSNEPRGAAAGGPIGSGSVESAESVAAAGAPASGEPDANSRGQCAEQNALHLEDVPRADDIAAARRSLVAAEVRGSLPETPNLALPAPETSGESHRGGSSAPSAAPVQQSPRERSGESAALVLREAVMSSRSPQREQSEALADARLELARRDAEIKHLQCSLTQLVAASQANANLPSSAASAYEQVCTLCLLLTCLHVAFRPGFLFAADPLLDTSAAHSV